MGRSPSRADAHLAPSTEEIRDGSRRRRPDPDQGLTLGCVPAARRTTLGAQIPTLSAQIWYAPPRSAKGAPDREGILKPSVGRIVRYVTGSCECYAAIINEVYSETCVSLHVFSINGLFLARSVPYDPEGESVGTWHWPPRD